MNSSKSESSRGPVTRRRAAEELRGKEDKKRRRETWKPRKIIGPNDIIVDTNKGKIKIEEDVDVKYILERVPISAQDPTQEEISFGHLDLVEPKTTASPVVKVEFEEGSNIQDGVRKVLLEEIDIPMDCGDGDDNGGMNEVDSDEVRKQFGPVTRRRAAEELWEKEDKKRRRDTWKSQKVIGPNDIIVDTNNGKIKVKCEEDDVDFKDVLERVLTPAHDPTQDDISLARSHFVSEDCDTTHTPVVKVEFVEEGSYIQDGVRNVLLEMIDITMDCCNGEDDAGMNEVNSDEVRKQCGSGCREKVEMLKNARQEQNQKMSMPVTRVTEIEKGFARLRQRLHKHEQNTTTSLLLPSDIYDCNVPEPSNSTTCPYKSENINKTDITKDRSDQDAAISLESSDDKVITLFPKVVKVFWRKYVKDMNDSKSYLNLNCRLVCKSWRDGIDYLLMNEYALVKTRGVQTLVIRCDDEYASEEKAKEIVEKVFHLYENNKKGWRLLQPRVLYIPSHTSELSKYFSNDSKYGRAICKFLEKFGSSIETFQHHDFEENILTYRYFLEAYSSPTFKNWIQLMPNLKCLVIRQVNKLHFFNPEPEIIESTKIEELVQLHSFPKLENLQSFRFSAAKALSSVIIPMVITNNNHISSFNSNMSLNFKQFFLPNLTRLTCAPNHETNLIVLPLLKVFDGKSITKLDFCYRSESASRDIWNIMSAIENITVMQLNTAFPDLYYVRPPLQFNNLKLFVLNIKHSYAAKSSFTVQFIFKMVSKMSSLERLKISGLRENTHNRLRANAYDEMLEPGSDSDPLRFGGTRTQCTKCLRKELVCKLWKSIPSLKLVTVERIIRTERKRIVTVRKDYFSFHRI